MGCFISMLSVGLSSRSNVQITPLVSSRGSWVKPLVQFGSTQPDAAILPSAGLFNKTDPFAETPHEKSVRYSFLVITGVVAGFFALIGFGPWMPNVERHQQSLRAAMRLCAASKTEIQEQRYCGSVSSKLAGLDTAKWLSSPRGRSIMGEGLLLSGVQAGILVAPDIIHFRKALTQKTPPIIQA